MFLEILEILILIDTQTTTLLGPVNRFEMTKCCHSKKCNCHENRLNKTVPASGPTVHGSSDSSPAKTVTLAQDYSTLSKATVNVLAGRPMQVVKSLWNCLDEPFS